MRASRSSSSIVTVLALPLFLVLGSGVALVTPVDGGPDEPSVQQYAHCLVETGELPDPTAVDVVQAQHPPLYYAWLALWIAALPGFDEEAAAAPVRLPYERVVRVPFDQQHESVVPPVRRELRAARGEMPPVRYPHALRFAGLLLGMASAVLVFVGVRRALPGSGAVGALAAACTVLIPQFAALHATPVNDQLAILLCTGALVLLVRPGDELRPVIIAAALFGLALLTKILALGPFVAGCALAATRSGRGFRMKPVLVLVLGPLLLAAWWYVRQALLTGSPIAMEVTARNHPGFFRSDVPDLWELVQVPGTLVEPYLGRLGGARPITPGPLWLAVGAALPLLILVGLGVTCLGRRVPRNERRVGIAGMLGGLVTVAILINGTRWFIVSEGRYLHLLALPAAWGLAAGVPRLLPRRAAPVIGFFAAWMAAGGFALLHLELLPRHHGEVDITRVPGGVTYLDLGTSAARHAVVAGEPRGNWGHRVADADRRMLSGPGDVPRSFALRLDGLDRSVPLLLSYRVFPPMLLHGETVRSAGHLELRSGGERLGGLFSCHAHAARWIHAALPPPSIRDAAVSLTGHGRGRSVGLSRVALRRLPWKIGRASRAGDRLEVAVAAVPDAIDGEFALAWHPEGAPRWHRQPLVRAGVLRFEGLAAEAKTVELILEGPEVVVADLKAFLAASRAAIRDGVLVPDRDVVAALSAPGLYGLRLDPARHAGREVLSVDESHLPRADVTRLTFLDEGGRPVPDGLLGLVRDGAVVPVEGGSLDLSGHGADSGAWIFQALGGHDPVHLDRIVATAPLRWRFRIELMP